MKRYMAKYLILLLLLLGRGVLGASNWAMQGADVQHSGATVLTVPTAVPSLQWAAKLGISSQCTPVMSPDNLFAIVGTDDGKLVWVRMADGFTHADDAAIPEYSAPSAVAFSGTPLVIGAGVSYQVFATNADGRLYCVDIVNSTYNVSWMAPSAGNPPKGPFVASPLPLTAGGVDYICVASTDGNVYLVQKTAPHTITRWFTAGGAIESTPTLGTAKAGPGTAALEGAIAIGQTAVTLTDVSAFTVGDTLTLTDAVVGDEVLGTITAVDTAGKIVTFSSGSLNVHTAAAGVDFIITYHQPLYFGCNDGRIYAINADELITHQRWVTNPASGYLTALTLQGNYLYASERNGVLRVINADTGVSQASFANTAYTAGAVLINAGQEYLITALRNNGFAKTDITDPTAIPAPARITGTAALTYAAATTTGDANALITSEDGTVVCLKLGVLTTDPLVQRWATAAYGSPLRGTPVVATDGVIIAVSADGHLLCWQAGGVATPPIAGKTPSGEWPMFQHDPAHSGGAGEPAANFTAPTDISALPGNKLRWASNTGGSVLSTTAVTRNSGEVRSAPLSFVMPAPLIGLRGNSTFTITDATHTIFHVGDPIIIPYGINGQYDDLGQITDIVHGFSGVDTDDITTTLGPTVGHNAGDAVQLSLVRRDNLRYGQTHWYGDQAKTVTPGITAGDIWYNQNTTFDPSTRRVTLFSRLQPHFTDAYGQELTNFLATYRGQSVTLGFMDTTVKNPANAASPVDFFLYLTDDGQLGMRRNLTDPATVDPYGVVINIPGAAAYSQAYGVDVMLTVGPDPLNPGKALAELWYRLAIAGVYPQDDSGYTKVGATLFILPTAAVGDTVLGTHIYPFFRGYDYSSDATKPNNGQPGYTPAALGMEVIIATNPADPLNKNIIGPGTTQFTVQNGGRLQVNDFATFKDPLTGVSETVKISSVSGTDVHVNTSFTNYYSAGASISVGQPGEWAAYFGSDDGKLRAVNPDTGALIWQQSVTGALGAVRGAPAIDSALARIYVNSVSGRLFAFAQSGLFLWSYPNLRAFGLAPASGSPIIDAAGDIYFTCEDGSAVRVTPDGVGYTFRPNATINESFINVGGPALYIAYGTQRLVYGARRSNGSVQSGVIFAVKTADMSVAWSYNTAGPVNASPVVGTDGTVYVGDTIGNVYAVFETPAGAAASRWLNGAVDYAFPVSGAAAIDVAGALAGDTLYVGDRSGTIHAISGGPDKIALLESSFTLDGPVTGPLTLDAAGNLLVSTGAGSVYDLGRADSWPTTARSYPGIIATLLAATKEGILAPAISTAPVYDIAGGTITLSGKIFPRFVNDAGTPLATFAGGAAQEARFGLQDDTLFNPGDAASHAYFYLYVTDDGKLSMRNYVYGASAINLDPTVIPPKILPANYALANGIELQLVLSPTLATGYYRLADADGIFKGTYTKIGDYALATAAASLSPMLQGADLSVGAAFQQAFAVTSSGITLYQGNTPGGVPGMSSPAMNWVWNVHTDGGMPVAKPFHTAPTLYQGAAVIVGGDDGTVYAIGPDGSAGASAPQPDLQITQPGTLWPFFHRDGYREGNLATVNPAAPGPQQPTERWFADTHVRLSSSPVVTVNTPDRVARVYQGAENGHLYGYNASTGAVVWDALMPYKGGIQATPAVGADGSIAVGALDGRLYLYSAAAVLLLPPVLSAPVLPDTTAAVTRTMATKMYVHSVVLQTNDPGTFSIVDAAGKSRVIQTYNMPNAGIFTIIVDEIVSSLTWTPAGATPSLALFDVYGNLRWDSWTANATANAAGQLTIQQYIMADDTAFAPQTAPYTDTKVIARFTTPTFVGSVNFTTADAGTISVRGADDKIKTLLTVAKNTVARDYTLLVNRQAKEIIWEAAVASTLTKFELFAPFTPGNFIASPVRGSDGTVYAATTDALHRVALATDSRDGGRYYSDEAMTFPLADLLASNLQDGDDATVVAGNGILVYNFGQPTYVSRIMLVTPNSGSLSIRVGGVKELLATYGTGDSTRPINVTLNRRVDQVIWENSSPLLDASVGEFTCYTTDSVLRHDGKIFVQDETTPAIMTGKTIEARFTIGEVVGKVIINTPDAGILRFYDDTGVELVTERQTLIAGVLTDQSFTLAATPTLGAVKWTAEGATSSFTKFELYDGPGTTLLTSPTYFVYDAAAVAPYTAHHTVEMNFRDVDNAPLATFVQRVTFATATAGILTAYNNNGTAIGTPLNTTAELVAKRYEYPIGRMVTRISWTAMAGNGDVNDFHAFTGAGQVYAFDAATGKMKWRSDNISPVWSSPAVLGGAVTTDHPVDVVYVATIDGQVYAFNGDDGSPHWTNIRQTIAPVYASLTLIDQQNGAGDLLVADSLGMLYQYDGAAGTTKATRDLNTPLSNAPAVNGNGVIFVVSDAGQVYRISANLAGQALSVNLKATVKSSPVLDSQGHLYVGADDGTLNCIDPLADTLLWAFPADRTVVSSTLAIDTYSGTNSLPITSIAGFRVGDPVNLTRPDGSNIISAGTIVSLTPPASVSATLLAVPGANQVNLTLNDASGMTVGSTISILPSFDPIFDPQPSLISLGNIVAIDTLNNIISLDRVVGTAYPAASTVFSGTPYGIVRISGWLNEAHSAGDILRVVRVNATPLRTSPAVGPAQTVYIGATDGMLYAVGPVGPAGFPAQATAIVYPESDSIWYTFHRNNQRTGYAGRPGPATSGLRWYQATGATLDSSPAIGYAEAGHPLGVLYQGMADVPDASGNIISHGALAAYDAALGTPLWIFTDNNRVGRVISSPAVVSIKDQYSPAHTGELIVFGTAEIPTSVALPLGAAIGVDVNGNETPVAVTPGQRIVALQVADVNAYPIGAQVYLADDSIGTNFEIFGVVSSRSGNQLRLSAPHIVLLNHNIASLVTANPGQQGRVYAVNRAGLLAWTFPRRGADPIGVINSSPAVSLPVVTEKVDQAQCAFYITTDDNVVYSLDFDGNERWHYAIAPVDSSETFFKLTSATLSSDGTRLYIGISVPGTNRGYVIALDTTATNDDDRVLWRTAPDALAGPVTATPMLTTVAGVPALYVGTDNFLPGGTGTFYQLNPDNGVIIRSASLGPVAVTAAAVPESNFFNYTVIAGAGNILTLNKVIGLVPGMRVSFPGSLPVVTAAITSVDNVNMTVTLLGVLPAGITMLRTEEQAIIIGDLNGRVTAFTPALVELWQYQTGGPILTSPAITGEISTPFSEPIFTGTGVNDIRPTVAYSGAVQAVYTISISATATGGVADKFTWQKDGGATTELPITGDLQSLGEGVRVRFLAMSGHTLGDSWSFTAYPFVRNYTAYVGSNDHNFTAINFFGNSHAVRWQKNMRDRLVSSPVVGMRSYADGRALVYQTSRDQYIYAFGSQYEPTSGIFSGPNYNPNPGGGSDVGGNDVWDGGTPTNTFPDTPTTSEPVVIPGGSGGNPPWDGGTTPNGGGGTGTGTTPNGQDPNGPLPGDYNPPVTTPIITPGPGGVPILDPKNPAYDGKKLIASTLQVSKSVEKFTGNPWIHTALLSPLALNDMTIVSAPLTGPSFNYVVKIDTITPTDTIIWSSDGGTTWNPSTLIPPANTGIDLGNGVMIAFDGNTGHGAGTTWSFTVPDPDLWNGTSADANWWKFSINVKNTGQGPIDTIDIQDILPDVLMDPNYTPFVSDSNWVTKVSPTTTINGPIAFIGAGVNDLKLIGGIAMDIQQTLMVKIDSVGPDMIVWSTDAGGTWSAPAVAISNTVGNPNLLPGGVRVVFTSAAGHVAGDTWTFSNYPRWQLNFHDQLGQRYILWPEDAGNRNQGYLSELNISFIARVRDGIPENDLELATVTADQTDPKVLAVSDVTALRKGQRIVIGDNDTVLQVIGVDAIQKTISIVPDDDTRTWAKLIGGTGTKVFLATKTKPTLKDSVMLSGTEIKETGAHNFKAKANLFLQLFNHPVPMEMGGSTMANNQLFVSANTYDGDNTKNKSLIERKETPVQNGWTGVFRVRLYYNGYVYESPSANYPAVKERNLTRLGPGAEPRAFSPYNQLDPETGLPLTFVIERNLNQGNNNAPLNLQVTGVPVGSPGPQGYQGMRVFGAISPQQALQNRMVAPKTGRVVTYINGQTGQATVALASLPTLGLNTATSGFEIPLATDDILRYDRTVGGIGGLVKSLTLPYAWRVTIQQARTRMNQRIPDWGWGKEVPFIDRAVQGARVSLDVPAAAGATTVLLTKPASLADEARFLALKNHRVLFHHPTNNPSGMSDVEAFVTDSFIGAADATLTLAALTQPLAMDATVRDEWAPDFILINPVSVTGVASDGKVTLGTATGQTPGKTAITPVIGVKNDSLIDAQPNGDMFRLLTIPSDLRNDTATPKNWNDTLTGEFALGQSHTNAEWNGFQYDPYLEFHLPMRSEALSVPFGSGLHNNDSFNLRLNTRLPAHQQEGNFATRAEVKPTLTNALGIIYWETNNLIDYQYGKDFRLDDINKNGAWDVNEMLYLDRNNNGVNDYGEPAVAYGATDTRVFMDLNGNRVWDFGEPFYMTANAMDIASLDMTTPNQLVNPTAVVNKITDANSLRPVTPIVDGGKLDARTTIRLPFTQPLVENVGNSDITSTLPGNYTPDPVISLVGMSPRHNVGGTATNRTADELNPYTLQADTGSSWTLPKSPAGSELDFRRPFAVPMLDEYRQPAGTYTGRLTWGSNDPMFVTMRIAETRLSQSAPDENVPPVFDARNGGPAGWTNNLTGMESWPTSAILANGDLGVWVASNTPLAPGVLPTTTTDTTIWYREARRRTAAVSAIGTTSVTVAPDIAAQVHGDNTGTGDLLVLRKRPVLGETEANPGAEYAVVQSVDTTTGEITLTAPLAWTVAPVETVVEIMGHPWVPAVTANDLSAIRMALKDPNSAYTPTPIVCTSPAVTPDGTGKFHLTFTVAAVRQITNNGKVNYYPTSYIAYKLFDPASPQADGIAWVGAPDATTFPQRDKAIMLTGLVGNNSLAIYEAGATGGRGLYAASGGQLDIPLNTITWAFTSVGRPQAWVDSADTTHTLVHLVVQGTRADGNTDIYYARARFDPVKMSLSALALKLPEAPDQRSGIISEALTANATNTLFTGGAFLGWNNQLTVTVDGVDHLLAVAGGAWDTTREYPLDYVQGGAVVRLRVDPYRGNVRVLQGSITSVTLAGIPRLQRLTRSMAPDINPVIALETNRAGTVVDPPRLWLYWVRQMQDGLGNRVLYNTMRLTGSHLEPEQRGRVNAPGVPNVDMPERMLPMEVLGADGAIAITPQRGNGRTETGLWVLTTATRAQSTPYAGSTELTVHDLYLQVVNVPVPD